MKSALSPKCPLTGRDRPTVRVLLTGVGTPGVGELLRDLVEDADIVIDGVLPGLGKDEWDHGLRPIAPGWVDPLK